MPNLSAVVESFEQRLLERTMRFDDVGIGVSTTKGTEKGVV